MKTSILITIGLFVWCISGMAQKKYVGVWESGHGGNLIHKALPWNAFLEKDKEMKGKGLRLDDFEIIKSGIRAKYVGSWKKGQGKTQFSKPLEWKDFLDKGKQLTQNGYRLIDFEIFMAAGKRKYVGFWKKGSGNNIITKGLRWKDFLDKGKEMTSKGFRLADFETYKVGGKYRYVGNWRSGSGSNIITKGLKWKSFLDKGKELTAKGLRLYDLEIVKIGSQQRYVGAWKNSSGSNIVTKGLKWNTFLNKGKQLTGQGLRLADFEIFTTPKSPVQNTNTGPDVLPDPADFPKVPSHVKLLNGTQGSDKYRVVVDFTKLVDGKPQITIPTQFLKDLPSYNGKIIFPDNFCGLNIIKAQRFMWHTQNDGVYKKFPFNYIPESSSILKEYSDSGEGEYFYRYGINFTGPMGKCATSAKDWVFEQPFMKQSTSFPQPLKLIIELNSDSEVKFLNYKIVQGKPLSALKLFKPTSAEKLLKYYEKTLLGSLEKWIKAVCKENPKECPEKKDGKDQSN
ncbi:hypothetical protein ACFQ1M_14415 [Sungkyunkwania multivorans]|uniref:Uncharacterized protein n=1 Tax=Sungkyunkwania multivorans TaxID=1173618 RepID=A0ABW3D010_9FLAO